MSESEDKYRDPDSFTDVYHPDTLVPDQIDLVWTVT